MEQDGHKVPKGVHTKIVADRIDSGDWLAMIYDKNWWLATWQKSSRIHIINVNVELFHLTWAKHTVSSKRKSK